MKYCKHVIKMAMDDVKDAEMILGYAREAKDSDMESFFAGRVKTRLRELDEDREMLRIMMGAEGGEAPVWEHLKAYLSEKSDELRWALERR